MSISSESRDFLDVCEFSLCGTIVSAASGICTASGKGEVGRGFWAASAPLPNVALVGVVASSMADACDAAKARGVVGEMFTRSSFLASVAVGELTGLKAAIIMMGG